MDFHIVDTESAYRRLLAAPDADAREQIFREQLVGPFRGLIDLMGGGDGLEAYARWGMSPGQFAGEQAASAAERLDTLARAGAWAQAAEALAEGWEAWRGFHDRVGHDRITFGLMLCDLNFVPYQRGYSGFGAIPGYIMTVYGKPDAYNLARLKAATAHELHHNLAGSVIWGNFMQATVGQYMIGEGLAESFAAELYGEDLVGYYVTDFVDADLERTKQTLFAGLEKTGFNTLRGYIFGGEIAGAFGAEVVDLPPFAGYAIGYRVAQAYLKRTGRSVVEASYVPASEIIVQSGYFD